MSDNGTSAVKLAAAHPSFLFPHHAGDGDDNDGDLDDHGDEDDGHDDVKLAAAHPSFLFPHHAGEDGHNDDDGDHDDDDGDGNDYDHNDVNLAAALPILPISLRHHDYDDDHDDNRNLD